MNKEDRKIEILKSAAFVFSKCGFHGAKMQEIAQKAGIGKGTIYEYFESKEFLFRKVLLYTTNMYINETKKILNNDNKKVKQKIIDFFEYHGEFLIHHVDVAQIVISQHQIFPKELRIDMMKRKKKIFDMIQNTIKQGIKNGELKKDLNEELASLIIIGSVSQFYFKKIFFDRKSNLNISPEPIIDLIFRGLE